MHLEELSMEYVQLLVGVVLYAAATCIYSCYMYLLLLLLYMHKSKCSN